MTHRKLLVAALAVLVVYVVWNRQAAEICDARAQRCAAARCSDLEWQYILACEHAGLLFSNQQNQ